MERVRDTNAVRDTWMGGRSLRVELAESEVPPTLGDVETGVGIHDRARDLRRGRGEHREIRPRSGRDDDEMTTRSGRDDAEMTTRRGVRTGSRLHRRVGLVDPQPIGRREVTRYDPHPKLHRERRRLRWLDLHMRRGRPRRRLGVGLGDEEELVRGRRFECDAPTEHDRRWARRTPYISG